MHEKILQKLDEIRQKPEHVRMWYVWACVFIVMFFVVAIWIFSLQENFRVAIPETAREAGQALPKAAGQKSLDDLEKNDQRLTPDPAPSAASGQDYFNGEITRLRDQPITHSYGGNGDTRYSRTDRTEADHR